MKGLQLSEPVRLYSRRKLLSFVLFLVTNFSAILVPKKSQTQTQKNTLTHTHTLTKLSMYKSHQTRRV